MIRNIQGRLYARLKYIWHRFKKTGRYKLTKRLLQHIETEDCKLSTEEKTVLKKLLSSRLVSHISYPFVKEYEYRPVKVLWDETKSLYYVYHHAKRLYFKKGLPKPFIRYIYNDLCLEQDIRSPHSYFVFPIQYHDTDIAVDIGAAEGIWALDIVEKVRELYLFEYDEDWIKALQATFEPWKDKVHIVNKYVSDVSDSKNTTLDDYFYARNIFPTIIKADVEGAEIALVKGASGLLSNHIAHAIICTYHNPDDFAMVLEMVKEYYTEVDVSNGYLIDIYSVPHFACHDFTNIFRKGVIHAHTSRRIKLV